ncbi:uncharacterized protein LOC131008173 [Salvia miltiorrhiza]|uniref:uncharacterized protein LOC131008173 n=1 Tax=Salvia miltiorrhiza TaxID=226208 RepID=UPI0025AD14EA|nr:uncharacterized protein LOC131008173 [Salvia miltiorrhiza]
MPVSTAQGKAREKAAANSIPLKLLLGQGQKPNKTSKEFTPRFTEASLEVPKAESQIKGYAFIRGLRPRAFFDNLQIKQPRDFDDILARLPGYIHLKEARAAQKTEYNGNKPKKAENKGEILDTRHQGRAPYRGLPPRVLPVEAQPTYQPARNEQTYRGVNNVNRLTDQTPLNKPQEEIFHLIKNEPWFRVPRDFAAGLPSQDRMDCCVSTTIIMDTLQNIDNNYNPRAGREQGNQEDDRRAAPPRKEKRQVHMIIREESGPISNRARKQTIRSCRVGTLPNQVMSVHSAAREPSISFGPEDHAGLVHQHDDALVFSADVANCTVHRIFVDSSSAVNIIYKDYMTAMALDVALKPPGNPLFSFRGKSILPLGSLELPMMWGKEGASRTRILKFLVVDFLKPNYNIIIGRPTLNAFQVMISMYHLKMKFPLENGRVGEVSGNQFTSKERFVKSLTTQVGIKRAQSSQGRSAEKVAKAGGSSRNTAERAKIKEIGRSPDKQQLISTNDRCMLVELFPGKMVSPLAWVLRCLQP